MIKTTRNNPLHKVAILVASLDDKWSNRVLESLPKEQAAIVRQRVDQLVEIDPEEQEEVLAEFRHNLHSFSTPRSEGVELDLSSRNLGSHSVYSEPKEALRPLEVLSEADTSFIVEMLTGEHPQTIALVLSRLDTQQAAEVLSNFPSVDQVNIMRRLAELDTIDQESVEVVESQVARWIAEARQRKSRITAGMDIVNRIIDKTPSSQREKLIAEFRKTNSVLAFSLGKDQFKSSSAQAIPDRIQSQDACPANFKEKSIKSTTERASLSRATPPVNPFAHYTMERCLAELESLEMNKLVTALSQCETHVVRLALVGVSEKLLKRVLTGRPRRESRHFRQSLREMGPTRISDILAAQQEILFVASKLNN